MQFRWHHFHETSVSIRCRAVCLLGEVAHGVRFVEQAQLAALRAIALVDRIDEQ